MSIKSKYDQFLELSLDPFFYLKMRSFLESIENPTSETDKALYKVVSDFIKLTGIINDHSNI